MPTGGAVHFHTTHWSAVVTAGQGESPAAAKALAALCCTYWRPLYSYVRRLGHGPAEAQDLTQEFFARLIERRLLARADQQRGRFRTFLLTSLKHFLVNEWEKSRAAQRGGGRAIISWDEVEAENQFLAEVADQLTPEKVYEKQWASSVLEAVLRQLRAEATASGRGDLFERLKEYLWGEVARTTYAAIGAELGMTPVAVKVAAHRLRQRFREVLRAEIASTVATEQEIDEELRHLFEVVAS